MFRGAYLYDLNWAKMRGLVLNCEETLRNLQVEMTTFKSAMKNK
jgi:hypothetical protein